MLLPEAVPNEPVGDDTTSLRAAVARRITGKKNPTPPPPTSDHTSGPWTLGDCFGDAVRRSSLAHSEGHYDKERRGGGGPR